MSGYVKKSDVLRILFECIEYPEIDESDHAGVNYQLAKLKIMKLKEIQIKSEENE